MWRAWRCLIASESRFGSALQHAAHMRASVRQVMRLCCRFHMTLADVSSTLMGLSHACKEINTSKSLPLLMQVLAKPKSR